MCLVFKWRTFLHQSDLFSFLYRTAIKWDHLRLVRVTCWVSSDRSRARSHRSISTMPVWAVLVVNRNNLSIGQIIGDLGQVNLAAFSVLRVGTGLEDKAVVVWDGSHASFWIVTLRSIYGRFLHSKHLYGLRLQHNAALVEEGLGWTLGSGVALCLVVPVPFSLHKVHMRKVFFRDFIFLDFHAIINTFVSSFTLWFFYSFKSHSWASLSWSIKLFGSWILSAVVFRGWADILQSFMHSFVLLWASVDLGIVIIKMAKWWFIHFNIIITI